MRQPFKRRRKRIHNGQVLRLGVCGPLNYISCAQFCLLTVATTGPRRAFKCSDYSVGHRRGMFRMHVAAVDNDSDDVTSHVSNADEVEAILMRLGNQQGDLVITSVCALIQ